MVEVMPLGGEEGGDSLRPARAARTPSSAGAERSTPRAGRLGHRHRGPVHTTRPCHRPHLGCGGPGANAPCSSQQGDRG
jgi:hypothetical protein